MFATLFHRCFPAFCALLAFSLILMAGATAHAAPPPLSSTDKQHAKNAFYFADRSNWHEAILHAKKAKNPVLRHYITWLALKDWGSEFDFKAFSDFVQLNPSWPDEKRLVFRAEDRIYAFYDEIDRNGKIRWFNRHKPITGKGKLAYARILEEYYGLPKAKDHITKLIREAWEDGDFDVHQEKAILQDYRPYLRQEDHLARIDRLIWEGKTSAAARVMFLAPKSYQALFEARIRLQLNKPGVNRAISHVSKALQADPGLIYERMQWRQRKGLDSGVVEMLLAAPANVPHPEKWWSTRHYHVREALDKGRYSQAAKLLENHGQEEGASFADALWLQGWIKLVYLNRPGEAMEHFSAMEKAVSYPVSKARGAYWLARAAMAAGQPDTAQRWYDRAAAYNTTFYGQLALQSVRSTGGMVLPHTTQPTPAQRQQFEQDRRVQVVYMLGAMGRQDETKPFIRQLMEEADSHAKALLVAELGIAIGQRGLSVQASKDALKNHIVLPTTSYPYYRLNFKPAIEPALVWAITRQESIFDSRAQSRSGARGLMQLMPATARDVAREIGERYSTNKLYDSMFNLKLGSHYLAGLIDRFDGSYILAIAAYNAGPTRIAQWVKKYGYPGKTPEAAINWIERIPYSETRNYVQRVLENLQVYRAVLSPKTGRTIRLNEDLTRTN